jgi:phosphopantothenoylcysteine decarboxylase/phosphopantothenate--cysteine ligase
MNSVMWENSIVQENVARLKRFGYIVVEPEWGSLATTSEGYGVGRLASIDVVVEAVFAATVSVRDLAGKRVLVSAGPTRERIDPIRFITNFSSGKMGFAIAETARLRGAEVTLIAGPNRLRPPSGVTLRSVESALEMERAINDAFEQADILIMAAAVADYRPAKPSGRKVKKAANRLNLELVKTTDILAELGKRKGSKIHVGFALETDAPETNARKKLADKNLDLVVLNNPFDEGAAFGGDTNVVTLLSKSEEPVKLPRMSKRDVANHILDRVVALCATRQTKQVAVQV